MLGETRRHPSKLVLQPVTVGDVPLEGLLAADRGAFRARLERACVDPAGALAEQGTDLAGQEGAQVGIRERCERTDRLQARGSKPSLGARPTPGSLRTSNGARNDASVPGGTTVRPAGLRRSLAILATTLLDATLATRSGSLLPHRGLHRLGNRPCLSEAPGDLAEVEVALVHPGPLDGRHHFAHGAPHRLRVLLVDAVPRPDEDRLRAPAQGLRTGHRGLDPEPPRLVVRRRDDSASVRISADDKRVCTELALQLLDGGEEGVQIEVPENDHAGTVLRGVADLTRAGRSVQGPSRSISQASPSRR